MTKYIDPYAAIEKTPLYAHDGMRSNGYSVRVQGQDDEGMPEWEEAGIVSSGYLLAPNLEVRNAQDALIERLPFKFEEKKVYYDGRHFMRTVVSTDGRLSREIRKGDMVNLGIVAHNTYDGTHAASLSLFVSHLVCLNGMVSRKYFLNYRFRHTQQFVDWPLEVEAAFKILSADTLENTIENFARRLTTLTTKVVSPDALRLARQDKLKHYSEAQWGGVVDQFLKQQDYTEMGLLDACTYKHWHSKSWANIAQTANIVDSFIPIGNEA